MFLFLFSSIALVQPSVLNSQDAVKDSPFSAMIPPAGFMASMFHQVQQATNEKPMQSADGMDAAAELTLQGEQMLMCSSMREIQIVFVWWTL